MKRKSILFVHLLLFVASSSFAQHTLWQQGFEGASICYENWGFTGGEVDSRYVRNGNGALLIGRGTGGANTCSTTAGSPLATFNWVDVANVANAPTH